MKKNKIILYKITDNIKKAHTIFGDKWNVCNKPFEEFDFHKLSDFHCCEYHRLYPLSKYWNKTWLLGGDNGRILCYKSEDKGIA